MDILYEPLLSLNNETRHRLVENHVPRLEKKRHNLICYSISPFIVCLLMTNAMMPEKLIKARTISAEIFPELVTR